MQEQPRRILHLTDAVGGLLEAPDLVGRTETVFQAAQEAQPGVPVALEIEHHVHQMLHGPRTGDGAVLGHVPDHEDRDPRFLRQRRQRRRDGAGLRDPAARPLDSGGLHRLHGIDDQQARFHG